MSSAALIQKARLLSPTVMPAYKVFEMATLNGARALGMEDKLGSLEVGKKADLVIVNLDNLHSTPSVEVDVISQLVYAAKASDVETTIIDGKIVMENKKLITLNEKNIKEEANKLVKVQIDLAGVKK